jgi:3-hydroxybutyryl-CoA dehydratase
MNMNKQETEFKEGDKLPELTKHITQKHIELYAEASKDFNPIHIDPEYAKKTALGGTIAHGMLSLSYISELMCLVFNESWLSNGSLDVRFKTPARPGDTITIYSSIKKIEKQDTGTLIRCDVLCSNQNNETIVTGEIEVRV